MIQTTVLTQLQNDIEQANIFSILRVREGTQDWMDLTTMISEGLEMANAKALVSCAEIVARQENRVSIEGVWFTSNILARNLEESNRVFPFLVTCGMELEVWSERFGDVLQRYWAESIKEAVLRSAMNGFFAYLNDTYHPGHISTMSPGSLENWPIGEQLPLFRLLGDTEGTIGVQLTESLLMRPTKSVSGLVFERSENFASCELCPRFDCPNRRAPYDETLFERVYCPKQS